MSWGSLFGSISWCVKAVRSRYFCRCYTCSPCFFFCVPSYQQSLCDIEGTPVGCVSDEKQREHVSFAQELGACYAQTYCAAFYSDGLRWISNTNTRMSTLLEDVCTVTQEGERCFRNGDVAWLRANLFGYFPMFRSLWTFGIKETTPTTQLSPSQVLCT